VLKGRINILFLGDILIFIASFLIMIAIRFDFSANSSLIKLQAEAFSLLFLLWLLVFFVFDLYNLQRINPNPTNIGLLIIAMVVNGVLSMLLFYLNTQPGISPKTNLVIVTLIAICLLVFWRRTFFNLFTKKFKRRIAIIGTTPLAQHLLEELHLHPHIGEAVLINDETNIPERNYDLFITQSVDPKTLVTLSHINNVEVLSLSEAYKNLFGRAPIELLTDEKAIEIITGHESAGIKLLDRIIEIIVASFVFIVTLPIVLIAMICIYLEDSGPVIYKQARVGLRGKNFFIYKLRSMKKNAEAEGIKWAEKNDARITKVGGVLRKLHIDEIPQMINILKGDLSLIGPRPERPELVAELEQKIPYYFLRHTVKPGFTGWAQIKYRYARSINDSKEKFEYDLYYLLHKNPLLDVGILIKTIQIIFTH
jgi:lipopolysaccharide/colanic/teichoic acid biosynthesis glycosyltransferase